VVAPPIRHSLPTKSDTIGVFMSSALKITFGILLVGVCVPMKLKGRFRGMRRMTDFALLCFAGIYLIVAGILDFLGKT